ncbi:hypothetical protein [Nocardia sp. NPDC019395]|uniref:hypothetical protein n=1 Tax=Nocardia sp. NPDC019395 TaxID=3154686 RepID=UPI0033F56950
MTLFVALVGVGTSWFFAYRYLVSESRLPELLDRHRPLGSIMDDSVTRYDTERGYRDLDAARTHRNSLRARPT